MNTSAENKDVVYFAKTSLTATVPKKERDDAGYDLFASEPAVIEPWSSVLVNTNIKVSMPRGVYGRVASRSGLAVKANIEVGAGVIDNGYRGDIKVLLRNFSDKSYQVQIKDKIAQLILTPYVTAHVNEIDDISALGDTSRGDKGFGSSGR